MKNIKCQNFNVYLFFCCGILLIYCSLVWVQSSTTINQVVIFKKTVRIINFQSRNFHTWPLFKQISVLKIRDKMYLQNILFVSKFLNNLSPTVFNKWFTFSSVLDSASHKPNSYGITNTEIK